jgi:hypothetical protein
MTEKLAGLVIPVLEPLGYRQGWGIAAVARIRQEIPEDVRQLTLCQQNIEEVLTCGWLWQGKEVATEIPAHVYLLHCELVVRATKEYIERQSPLRLPSPSISSAGKSAATNTSGRFCGHSFHSERTPVTSIQMTQGVSTNFAPSPLRCLQKFLRRKFLVRETLFVFN